MVLFFNWVDAQQPSFAMGDSLYIIGNYSAAINAYAEAGTDKASLQIARAYNAIGNYEKAIKQYQSLIKKDSTALLPQFEVGKIYDKTKNYEASEKLFKRLTKKSPKNAEFFYFLGKAFQKQLDYDNANEALHKAIELDDTHLRSIYLLGKYYVGVEEPINAHRILDIGLRTAPNDLALINLKALAYYDNSQYENAIPLFEKLLAAGERQPFIYKKLGNAYRDSWQPKKALETFRSLSEIINYEPDGFLGMAQVFLKEKQLDSAEVYFLKSIEERRYVFDNEYGNLGRIAREKGRLKKALDYYTLAWQEDPLNQFHYWQVCVLADEYYKDPKTRLRHYEKLLVDYENLFPFLKARAQKRISELKEEIHFAKE